VSKARTDFRLVAAVVAPLLLVAWLPRWDASILDHGLTGAIVVCVSVAVLEEVIFRGALQGWLLGKKDFKTTQLRLSRANWLTSFIFAAAHLWKHPLGLVPGYLAVSLVLGYFRERYGGILVPVILHAYYNLVLLFLPPLLNLT
jgi:membrane protease YdiL (CAAX protease family)